MATIVSISPDVLYQEVDDEMVMLDTGPAEHYYGLDDIGTRMWQLLAEHGDTESVIAAMLHEYDVEEALLRADLAGLIEKLSSLGLLSVENRA